MNPIILLIDDSDTWGRYMVETLSDEGFRVLWARSKRKAENFLEKNKNIEAVITNLNLKDKPLFPDGQGYSILAYLRERHPKLPKIVLSALGTDGKRVRNLYDLDNVDYVAIKPDTVSDLEFIPSLVSKLHKLIPAKVAAQAGVIKSLRAEKYEKEIFVSYAWGDESERTVDKLEQAFTERGIRIVRDKKALDYKGSIKEFEQRIGQGQCIVLVISDKYLRSEHCMYELVEIAENKEFRKRVFPIVLEDARLYKAVERLEYIKYWDNEIELLDTALKQVKSYNLKGISANLDKYFRIRANIDSLTDLLSDMNTLTPDLLAANGFSTLISNVKLVLT
jgi:CheY-like chemotaxis protein